MTIVTEDLAFDTDTIRHLMITCFEGGSNYWIDGAYLMKPTRKEFEAELGEKYEGPWYAEPSLYTKDFEIDIVAGEDDGTFKLTPASLEQGWKLMLKYRPHLWADIRNEDFDADHADIWLQLALFGECVYS